MKAILDDNNLNKDVFFIFVIYIFALIFLREFIFFRAFGLNITIDRLLIPFLFLYTVFKNIFANVKIDASFLTIFFSIVFLISLFMSTLLNGIDILGIKFIIRWFEYLLIPFFIINSFNPSLRQIQNIFKYGVMLIIFVACIEYILFNDFVGQAKIVSNNSQIELQKNTYGPFNFYMNTRAFSQGYRISSLYENPLTLTYIFYSCIIMLHASDVLKTRLSSFFIFSLYLLLAYFSISRIGTIYVILLIFFIFFYFRSQKKSTNNLLTNLVIFILLFVSTIFFIISILLPFFLNSYEFIGSNSTRLLAIFALPEFISSSYLFFGYGIGTSTYIFFPLFSSVDNLFLNILYEAGIFSLFFLCLTFFLLFRFLFKIKDRSLRSCSLFFGIGSLANFLISASIYTVTIFVVGTILLTILDSTKQLYANKYNQINK